MLALLPKGFESLIYSIKIGAGVTGAVGPRAGGQNSDPEGRPHLSTKSAPGDLLMNFLVPGAPGAFPWILTALTADVARQINSEAFKKHLKIPNCTTALIASFSSRLNSEAVTAVGRTPTANCCQRIGSRGPSAPINQKCLRKPSCKFVFSPWHQRPPRGDLPIDQKPPVKISGEVVGDTPANVKNLENSHAELP